MAIVPGQVITYKDLYDDVINRITSICKNINSMSGVPSTLKNGTVVRSVTFNACTATFTVNDPLLTDTNYVNKSEVLEQLEKFMKDRGINIKSGKRVTTKGILNFYNNLSCFTSTKFVQVINNFTNQSVTIYDKTNSSYPTVPVTDNITPITKQDVVNTYNNLMQTMNMTNRLHYITTSLTTGCSCSSSSSSSSSSSCSSSSSLFIAYMKV